jgi:NitT/TauT family transport system permease protein
MQTPDNTLGAQAFLHPSTGNANGAYGSTLKSAAALSIKSAFIFLLPQIAFFVLLTLAWEGMALWLASPLVPRVDAIYRELLHIAEKGFVFREIGITFFRMSLGFLLALVIALPLGILTAVSKTAARFVEPGLILGLTVPGLVWALLCVIWFGVSLASPVISVALGVLPSLVISVQQGIRSLSLETVEMAHVFRLTRRTLLWRIWLPLLYSFLITGCRLGFSIAWKVIVLAEIFGMSNGVGYQLNAQFSGQNVEGVIAWTLAFWLAMLVVEHGLFAPLERHSTRWQKASS